MNGNNKKETGTESVHSNQSETDNLKPDNDSYLFGYVFDVCTVAFGWLTVDSNFFFVVDLP